MKCVTRVVGSVHCSALWECGHGQLFTTRETQTCYSAWWCGADPWPRCTTPNPWCRRSTQHQCKIKTDVTSHANQFNSWVTLSHKTASVCLWIDSHQIVVTDHVKSFLWWPHVSVNISVWQWFTHVNMLCCILHIANTDHVFIIFKHDKNVKRVWCP